MPFTTVRIYSSQGFTVSLRSQTVIKIANKCRRLVGFFLSKSFNDLTVFSRFAMWCSRFVAKLTNICNDYIIKSVKIITSYNLPVMQI